MNVSSLLSQRALFDQYVNLRRHNLSCFHFSSIFLWKDFFTFDFQVIDGFLCVFAKHALGTFLYLPPLGGPLNAAIIAQCFDELNRRNSKRSFSRIENVEEEDLQYFDLHKYRVAEKSKEYCYRKKDLIEFKGNRYKSKRSSLNQFLKNSHYSVVSFERKLSADCALLFDRWLQNRKHVTNDDIYNAMLDENRQVHALAFEYSDELGLEGLVVCVDEKPQAYTLGYPLNDDTFCVLVEITNLDIKGLSVFIFHRLCQHNRLNQYSYINAMDDFAMTNIAAAKQSFHPSALYPSYVVTERE